VVAVTAGPSIWLYRRRLTMFEVKSWGWVWDKTLPPKTPKFDRVILMNSPLELLGHPNGSLTVSELAIKEIGVLVGRKHFDSKDTATVLFEVVFY
jgi:hypothetical protein